MFIIKMESIRKMHSRSLVSTVKSLTRVILGTND